VAFGEGHVDDDGEDSANNEDLKHDILEGVPDQLPEASSLWEIFLVITKSNGSGLESVGVDTIFSVNTETVKNTVNSAKFFHVIKIFDVLSLTIFLNNLGQLVFREVVFTLGFGTSLISDLRQFNAL